MTEHLQTTIPGDIGSTIKSYIKQIFDIASSRGDTVAIDVSEEKTNITWNRNGRGVLFGVMIPKNLSLDDQAYEAARTYNLTCNLGIAEPNL